MLRLDRNFQSFLEAAPDAIVVVDDAGRIVMVNGLAESMFGYPRELLLSKPVELLVPERFRSGHAAERHAYAQNPRTRPMGAGRDLWGRRSSGEEFPIQISLSPIETESGALVTSIIRDVTVQRQAEERFRGLLESAPDGIVVVDARGAMVIVNSQAEMMFGYTREELVGQPIELLVPERFRDAHKIDRRAYSEDPRTRAMGAGRPLTGRRKNGSEFPVEISLSPLRTDQGMLVTSIVRDITERRRAEAVIQASLREKEALLREIHHRVKNNLQVTSSLLRLQAAAISDPATREMFAETQSRIRSMALVHEKLYQSTNLERIDFVEYVRTLGELLLRSSAMDRSAISFKVTGSDVYLSVETAVPCGLIVNELLSNALKHAFPSRRRGSITVDLRCDDSRVCTFVVCDDGVGLSSDLDPKNAETLGLQLVRRLVEQLEGEIAIDGRDGAQFRLTFPAEVRAHA